MRSMQIKAAAAIVIAVILSVAGYFGYAKYQESQFIQTLTPHVKNTSLRVGNSTRFETEKTNITFKELFDRLEADIAEIDRRVLEIQSVSTPKTTVAEPTIAYMKASQEYLRALLQKYRKHLAANNALDWSKNMKQNLLDSNSYGLSFALQQLTKAVSDLEDATAAVTAAEKDVQETVGKLKDARAMVASIYSEDALVPTTQLDAVAAKNAAMPSEAASAPAKTGT